MQPSTTIDVKKTLDDLAESSFPNERRQAALALGQVSATSEEILRALIAAETLDAHAGVRTAAAQSLQAPVHQTYLQAHTEFRHEAAELAERNRAQRIISEEERIVGEFIERRQQVRLRLLGFFGVFLLWWGTFLLPFDLVLPAFRGGAVLALGYVGYVFWWSWKHYRCPACDSWLGALKAQVNPWFSSPPLRCPNCGAKLL